MSEQRTQKLSISQSMQKVSGTISTTKTWQYIELQRILKIGRLSKRLSKTQNSLSLISKSKK